MALGQRLLDAEIMKGIALILAFVLVIIIGSWVNNLWA